MPLQNAELHCAGEWRNVGTVVDDDVVSLSKRGAWLVSRYLTQVTGLSPRVDGQGRLILSDELRAHEAFRTTTSKIESDVSAPLPVIDATADDGDELPELEDDDAADE